MSEIVVAPAAKRQSSSARAAVLLSFVLGAGSALAAVQGRVQDASGAPVAGAGVVLVGASGTRNTAVTTADGAFVLEPGADKAARVEVRADGFALAIVRWTWPESSLAVTLDRLARHEELAVTASRAATRLGDEPARVVVLGQDTLRASGGLTVDDALRTVPGFSLFRRTSSSVANPTAQGVSLRGVGPSGASRALVLLDGVPLNDAFGGWVYWSRIPQAALERVELVEGASSQLYGSSALGGVIQAVTRDDAPAVTLETLAGSARTAAAVLYASARRGNWSVRAAGDAFTTNGYVLVSDEDRGMVDTAAGSRHLAGVLTLTRLFDERGSVFARASALGESRRNGTPLQVNDSDWQQWSGGGDWRAASGSLSVRAWHGTQTYHQTFSAVAPGRASEALTRLQHVPSSATGLTLQWSRTVQARHALLFGVEGAWVDGRSDETPVVAGRLAAPVSAGGSQRTLAAFAQDRMALGSRVFLLGGVRADTWWLRDNASAAASSDPGAPSPERSANALSPRLSLLVRAGRGWDVTAAAYGAFRAPTLNELYRSFRVGDTLTQANPDLTQERLHGAEAGLRWSAPQARAHVRLVAFVAEVRDPVANVTLTATPQLITRRRANLGRTRSRGFEFEAEAGLGRHVGTSVGYALTDATVQDFPADPQLEQMQLPQVPRHQATLQVRSTNLEHVDLSLLVRASSLQYEDDRNQLPLAGYVTLDARAATHLRSGLEAFVVVENVGGRRYALGATPLPTWGPARQARAGIRLDWIGRK